MFRSVRENTLNILLETHVEHLIRLIQDEVFELRKIQAAAFQMVNHATGRAHHNVGPTPQPRQLDAIRLATVNRENMHATQMISELLERIRHLQRKLTRRRQHQCLGLLLRAVQPRQDRQRKSSGLTGTGLS